MDNQQEGKIARMMNSISLALDSYDDIFSDFDESSYSKRIISDDFTREIEKRYNENRKGEFEVVFSLPQKVRSAKIEGMVKKRIKDHYKSKLKEVEDKVKKMKNTGVSRIALGIFLSLVEVAIRLNAVNSSIFVETLEILLIPAAWFSVWTGYEHFFDGPKEFVERGEFYRKFEKAEYKFVSEEEIAAEIAKAAQDVLKVEQKTENKQEAKAQEKMEERK